MLKVPFGFDANSATSAWVDVRERLTSSKQAERSLPIALDLPTGFVGSTVSFEFSWDEDEGRTAKPLAGGDPLATLTAPITAGEVILLPFSRFQTLAPFMRIVLDAPHTVAQGLELVLRQVRRSRTAPAPATAPYTSLPDYDVLDRPAGFLPPGGGVEGGNVVFDYRGWAILGLGIPSLTNVDCQVKGGPSVVTFTGAADNVTCATVEGGVPFEVDATGFTVTASGRNLPVLYATKTAAFTGIRLFVDGTVYSGEKVTVEYDADLGSYGHYGYSVYPTFTPDYQPAGVRYTPAPSQVAQIRNLSNLQPTAATVTVEPDGEHILITFE